MANCRECGTKVGCGCQLINGLCSACHAAAQQAIKLINYVATKIN
jgi:NMD protein affecting ribosome stability and mRNA decay